MLGMDLEPLLMQKFSRKSFCVTARPGNWCCGTGMMDSDDGRAIAALQKLAF
jgi:hypothetical protein